MMSCLAITHTTQWITEIDPSIQSLWSLISLTGRVNLRNPSRESCDSQTGHNSRWSSIDLVHPRLTVDISFLISLLSFLSLISLLLKKR